MTAVLQRISKDELKELISPLTYGNLTNAQRRSLRRCIAGTQKVWAGYVDETLLCVWGLVPPALMSEQAYLWLHTTKAMQEHVFIFVRHSQMVIEDMLKEYPLIVGETEVGADKSIRWLKWLGAKFGEPNGKMVPFVIHGKGPLDG